MAFGPCGINREDQSEVRIIFCESAAFGSRFSFVEIGSGGGADLSGGYAVAAFLLGLVKSLVCGTNESVAR